MSVPLSIDQRIRMLVWGWAVQGYGWEDIKVKLAALGEHGIDRAWIKATVLRAQGVRR